VNSASAKTKTAAVLTISDSSYIGKRADLSGPAIVRELEAANFKVIHKSVLPDEKDAIAARLIECSELTRLVVTTGGTGIAARDVTPEATLAVIERRIAGVEEKMRQEGAKKTPCGIKPGRMRRARKNAVPEPAGKSFGGG